MNKNLKAGADIHAGDGGYGIGTREAYEEFNAQRNQSLLKLRAIEFVHSFYGVSMEDARQYYMDEVEAYMRLIEKGIEDE